MNRNEFLSRHWRYYLMLEDKFIKTGNYVEIHENNYKTYSNEYAMLLQAICAEIDVILKIFCEFNVSDSKNIKNYIKYIMDNRQDILDTIIVLKYSRELKIKPFNRMFFKDYYESCQFKIPWWDGNGILKHCRTEHFTLANLENTLNALGGLYLICTQYIKKISDINDEIDIPEPNSSFFDYENSPFKFNDGQIFTMSF